MVAIFRLVSHHVAPVPGSRVFGLLPFFAVIIALVGRLVDVEWGKTDWRSWMYLIGKALLGCVVLSIVVIVWFTLW
jgi:hypothetical protein